MTPSTLGPEWADAVQGLLDEAKLPTADLTGAAVRFYGFADGRVLNAVIGLEVRGEAGLLRSLAVRSESRGSGAGTLLVRSLESTARAEGIRELWLLTTTAEGFFQRQGYSAVPRDQAPEALQSTSEFHDVCPSSAICMMKVLT